MKLPACDAISRDVRRRARDDDGPFKIGASIEPFDQPFMRGRVKAQKKVGSGWKVQITYNKPPRPDQNPGLARAIKEGYSLSEFPGSNPDNYWWDEDEVAGGR